MEILRFLKKYQYHSKCIENRKNKMKAPINHADIDHNLSIFIKQNKRIIKISSFIEYNT